MTASRNQQDWTMLLNEYGICKKKLESKREGLRILMKQLEQSQIEKDVLSNKVAQLESELEEFKNLLGNNWVQSEDGLQLDAKEDATKIKTLNNLLQYSRQENQQIQNDFQNLKQLYNESQRDNQLLRTTLSKTEARKKKGINEKQGKEHLIAQLEEANSKVEALEEELQMMKDDKKDLYEEKDLLQKKNSRLNSELNYVLHNDDERILDIDNLVLENKYLKEVITQYKEEKTVALNIASKYKEAMQKNSSSHLSYLDLNLPSKGYKDGNLTKSFNNKVFAELQSVNQLLTEKVSEKETALKHQRNTNRVLGTRVSELEKKLKTLEISGLWSHEQRVPRTFRSEDLIRENHADGNNNNTSGSTQSSIVELESSLEKNCVIPADTNVFEGILIDHLDNTIKNGLDDISLIE